MNHFKSCFRLAAYHTGPNTHLDHLGVLAIQLGIPLLTPDPSIIDAAKKFYPELRVILVEEMNILSYLATNFDALLGCGKYWAAQLKPELELFFQKEMTMIFCPHGNSDKGRSLSTQDCHPPQDIALLYGQQMYDLWERTGVLAHVKSIHFTGNYRFAYYLKRKAFYDRLAEDLVFRFMRKDFKTILYAPTWSDRENPSPFLSICDLAVQSLTQKYNVLIKVHPLMLERHPAEVYSLMGRLEKMPGVHILLDFLPIYPLLKRVDLYLGDYSSIGYDALELDLPLYFLIEDEANLKHSDLAKVGLSILSKDVDSLCSFIDTTLEDNWAGFRDEREKLRDYSFRQGRNTSSSCEEEEGIRNKLFF